jgi:hypothetical protein
MFVVSKIKYAIFRSLWYVYMFEGLSVLCPRGCYSAMCDEELNYKEDCTCGENNYV